MSVSFLAGLGSGVETALGWKNEKERREERKLEREAENTRAQQAHDRFMDASYQSHMGAVPPAQGAYQPMTSGETSGLFELTRKHEGGGNPDMLFDRSQNGPFAGTKVSQMTIGQLKDFSNPSGQYGQWVKGRLAEIGHEPRVATPMGKHQFVGTTLAETASAMGLSDDTVFSEDVQDSMANFKAAQRLSGASTMAEKRAQLRAEWEGFKQVSNEALDAAIIQFESGRGQPVPSRAMGAM
ncbi:hypothetical protein [Celeribacter sp.]|uniref:hypothetical protein n=1 Tax=Celeribacter sp. TaxID=1890673 RepID=UPI003A8CB145